MITIKIKCSYQPFFRDPIFIKQWGFYYGKYFRYTSVSVDVEEDICDIPPDLGVPKIIYDGGIWYFLVRLDSLFHPFISDINVNYGVDLSES